jgi:hypothetical protein
MAYMSKGVVPGGPYPNKAGEYCGNHHKGSPALARFHETQEQADAYQKEHLAKMRFGRPHPCKAGTTAELEAQGYVGLYLIEDRNLMSWEVECETPLELTEPAAEGETDDRA